MDGRDSDAALAHSTAGELQCWPRPCWRGLESGHSLLRSGGVRDEDFDWAIGGCGRTL